MCRPSPSSSGSRLSPQTASASSPSVWLACDATALVTHIHVDVRLMTRTDALHFPVVINFPIDVSAHALYICKIINVQRNDKASLL